MTTTATATEVISASDLLSIPADRPEKLFSGDEEADKKLYRQLAKEYHPDLHPQFAEVFKRLSELKSLRDQQVENGSWAGAGVQELFLTNGKRMRLRYLRRFTFELGTVLLAPRSVTYLVREEHRALFQQGVRNIQGLRFANDTMREQMQRFLPQLELVVETTEGPALILKKTPDVVRLRDALDHLGGRIDPVHVAWIMSSLHNLGAYLQWANLTHNAFDLDNVFISPQFHSGLLLGGWWYARSAGEPMTHLPGASVNVWKTILPAHVTAAKKATPKLDRELIRLIGRSLLGDPGGTRLLREASIPETLRLWVTSPGVEDGIKDYSNWEKARDVAFGPRKFVVMDLTPQAMYGGS